MSKISNEKGSEGTKMTTNKKQLALILGANILVMGATVEAKETDYSVKDLQGELKKYTAIQTNTVEDKATNQQESIQNKHYLSDLTATKATVGYGSFRKDTNVSGQPISLNVDGISTTFQKGIAAHAPAEVIYQIPANVNIFETYLGIDNHQNGNVEFSLYLDDELVYQSGEVNKNNTQHIMVEVSGKQSLRIVVDDLGFKGQDHSILADAKFYQKDLNGFDTAKFDMEKPVFQFGKMTDASYQLQQAQHDFIQDIGKVNLFTFLLNDSSNQEFLEWFLNSQTMLDYYNISSAPRGNNKIGFLKQLKRIVEADASAKTDPMNQKIAMATALEYANDDIYLWVNAESKSDAVTRYQLFRDLNNTPGELRPIFKTLDVDLMRFTVCAQMSDSDFIWIREKVKREHPELLDTNSKLSNIVYKYLAYNPFNKYGDDVQRPGYYGENPTLATVIELGGVCGSISTFDVNVLRAFGVPANVIGQPGHAAVTFMTDEGNWSRNNNISSWGRSQGGTATSLATGSRGYNNTYNLLDYEARQDIEKYDLAKEYYQILQETSDSYQRVALQEKILDLVPLYVPVYREKIAELQAQEVKNPQEYHDLAVRIVKTFRNYPKPMNDLLEGLLPELEKPENRILLVDLAVEYNHMVDNMTNPYAVDVFQEEEFQQQAHKFRTILGEFSFDGENANRLMGAKMDTEYSLDGGVSYIPITEDDQLLLNQDVNKITVQNGILLRLRGTDKVIKLPFSSKVLPESVKSDDDGNRIIGITSEMEYSLDGGKNYLASDIPADLSGKKTVLVRYKKAGTNIGGDAKTLHFTPNETIYNRIKRDNITLTDWTSQQNDSDLKALNAIDGDLSTMWHTVYNRGDHKPHLTFKFNQAYSVRKIYYTPRQDSGTNGNVLNYTIYTSQDGQTFTPLKTGNFTYTNQDRKEVRVIDLPENHSQYIRFEINKGVNDFGVAVEIGFEIPEAEATQAEQDLKATANQKTAHIINKHLAQLKVEATSLKERTANEKVQAKITALLAKIEEESTKNAIDYQVVVNLQNQLSSIRDDIILAKSESVVNNDSPAVKEFLAKYQTVLLKANSSLTVTDNAVIVKALKDFEQLSVGDKASIPYVKNNLINKQSRIIAGTNAESLQTKYSRVIGLTKETVQLSDYHELNEAYYNTFALNTAAQMNLLAERAHLKELIDYLDNSEERFDEEVRNFKASHQKVLTMPVNDVTIDNFAEYLALVTEAEKNYQLLSTNAKAQLTTEVTHLDELKVKIAELDSIKAKQELATVIANSNELFTDNPKVKALWSEELSAAREVLESKVATTDTYRKAILDLAVKKSTLNRMIFVDNDNQFRANQFKERFNTLLAKKIDEISESDRDMFNKAKDQFRRLNDQSQSLLISERDQLNAIDAKLNPTAAGERLTKLKEKIKEQEKLVYGKYTPAISELVTKANDLTPVSMEKVNQLDKELAKIIKDNSAFTDKVRYEESYFAPIKAIRFGNVRLRDEQVVLDALAHLETVDTDVKAVINPFADTTLEQHLTNLKNKINQMKTATKEDLDEYDTLQDAINAAIVEVAGLSNLTQEELTAINKKLEQATTKAAVTQVVEEAKTENNQKVEEDLRAKQPYIDRIHQAVASVDEDSLEPENLEAFNDIKADAKYLENVVLNDLKQKADRVEKEIAKILAKDEEDKAIKAEQAAYDAVAREVKNYLKEIETQKAGQPAVKQEQLTEQIEQLNLALNRGLTKDELLAKKEVITKEVERILQEEVINPNEEYAKKVIEAKKQIQAMVGLTEEEKENFNTQLDNATSTTDVETLITKAQSLANKHLAEQAAQTEHTKKVAAAIKEVEGLEGLSTTEKQAFINQLQATQVGEDLQSIIDQAKATAQHNIEQATNATLHADRLAKALKEVAALEGLTDEERQGFIADLNATQIGGDLTAIVQKAKKKASENLTTQAEKAEHEKNIKQAQAQIEKMPGLTDEERTNFINQLVHCEIGCDTNQFIYKAQELSDKHMAAHEANIKQAQAQIEQMPGLTDEERTNFINELINCEIGCDTNQFIYEAQELSNKHVAEQKQAEHTKKVVEAVKEVKALTDLTTDEQQTFIEELQKATVGDNLAAIVQKAKDLANSKQTDNGDVAPKPDSGTDTVTPDTDSGDDTVTPGTNGKDDTTTPDTNSNPTPTPEQPSKQRGWIKENDKWCYYKENGQKAIGWLKDGKNWYFFNEQAKMQTGWLKDGNNWYYLKENGQMARGWEVINGTYYLFKDWGGMAQGEWMKVEGDWFYIHSDGTYAHNEWVGSYYLKQYGHMAHNEWVYNQTTGWHFINEDGTYAHNQWVGAYYLKDWGYMAHNEWIYDKNYSNWFKVDGNGHYLHDTWVGDYYLKANGEMAKNEWIYDKGHWYYVKDNGQYARNEVVDGYKLNASGQMM
ncbi:Glucan-binding domain-containing protein (YG repeat) [Granulicatella balaenopterae]|uniref:Glucan-binding domain-containing protein (YG repeat) n=1 Tax=Granulicatella balaenopterae TaxID=137733 RepID=A0A1H9NST6_9LACT|nr:NPCBM/NEW2 domain-containing protein [Granulicatella balaenopterae]SER39030.1 Glucan-binding domain-containing protein (YG repeat) [Granulicatella balaenopterae]